VRCILVTCICMCVCLSLATCPHYGMDPDVTWEVVGVPSSCAALGRFAIGARVLLLWQHGPNTKCQRVLELTLCVVSWVEHTPTHTHHFDGRFTGPGLASCPLDFFPLVLNLCLLICSVMPSHHVFPQSNAFNKSYLSFLAIPHYHYPVHHR